ncbi:MAG: 3'-5' exonuclease, partial [Kiritimatiellia bacterium]
REAEKASMSFSDFAILYRTDEQSRVICEALRRSGMPFQKRAHTALSDAPVVAAVVDRMLRMPEQFSLQKQLELAVAELAADRPEEKQELDVVLTVLRPLAANTLDRTDFLSQVSIGIECDLFDPRADRIALLTLHASKGLEFDTVFVVGCEEGLLPLLRGGSEDVEEERRLFFVGITRARQRLILSYARKRKWRGRVCDRRPSRFLEDIERGLYEWGTTKGCGKRSRYGRQLDLF